MNTWKVISDQDVKSIHEATLKILSEIGIIIDHPQVTAAILDYGGKKQGDRVLIPTDLVEKCISDSGKQVTIKGRNNHNLKIGDGTLHWHNLGGAKDVFDPRTGEKRPATIQDVRDSTRLLDALENVSTITPFFTPLDVPGELMSLAMYRYALPFTTKPLQGPGVQNAREVKFAAEMAQVIGPLDEMFSMSVSPVSPLTFPHDLVDAMVEIAKRGIPFSSLPCPTAGTTAPFSIAGALTSQNAEVLASIVIVQMINPGLPIIYAGRLAMMEPRTGSSVWGGVELGIASSATVQIGHYYGLPVNVYGLSTNSHSFEIQNGIERSMNAILPALAGADELSGIGEMDAGVMGSYAQMVIDNDIVSSVHRVLRGFDVNEDSLALDVIKSVMGGNRTFVAEEHTVKYLRSGEILISNLSERRSFDIWDSTGRNGLLERAQEKVEQVFSDHKVQPLSNEQEKELDVIMDAAEKELVIS
jgi:trimethylamine---corrinoid protein Co-methyltransferase